MNDGKNEPRSLAMFIASMLIFGSIGLIRRNIPLSSAFLAFWRGTLGGLFILAFLKFRKGEKGKNAPRRFLPLICSGVLMGINWILLFESFNHTTVAVATLCYYMQPTIVILLSPLLFREKLTAKKTACAAVAIAGMVLVSGVAEGNSPSGGNARGILLGLGAAVFYAAVVIINKKVTGIEPYRKTAVQLLSAGISMIPYWLLTGSGSPAGFSAGTILLLLVIGLFHTGIAYVLYFGSMDGLRTQSVALLSYIDPVSALFFSALFLREPLSVTGIIGAFLIIGSAILSEFRSPK